MRNLKIMTAEFYKIENKYPDWKDQGRQVDVRKSDGTVVTGRLSADVESDGEGGELAVWRIETATDPPNQPSAYLYEFLEIRYLDGH